MTEFSIGEVVELAGVPEGTLRMWERRHGFPRPARLASGHRRYSESDLEAVRKVVAQRAAGITLPIAIERASAPVQAAPALFPWLRRVHPQIESQLLSRAAMISLSEAIEQECIARAEHPIFLGCFQRERFYRRQEARWRELSRGAELACVFADFDAVRAPRGGPIEIPLAPGSPLLREWAIVCDAPGCGVCLSGLQALPARPHEAEDRRFELLWSVEPEVVRGAARVLAAIASRALGEPLEPFADRLDSPAAATGPQQLRLAAAITSRALSGISRTGGEHG
jgi:MerR family transcriptional regulator, light-induced transcriptional regulator